MINWPHCELLAVHRRPICDSDNTSRWIWQGLCGALLALALGSGCTGVRSRVLDCQGLIIRNDNGDIVMSTMPGVDGEVISKYYDAEGREVVHLGYFPGVAGKGGATYFYMTGGSGSYDVQMIASDLGAIVSTGQEGGKAAQLHVLPDAAGTQVFEPEDEGHGVVVPSEFQGEVTIRREK